MHSRKTLAEREVALSSAQKDAAARENELKSRGRSYC